MDCFLIKQKEKGCLRLSKMHTVCLCAHTSHMLGLGEQDDSGRRNDIQKDFGGRENSTPERRVWEWSEKVEETD